MNGQRSWRFEIEMSELSRRNAFAPPTRPRVFTSVVKKPWVDAHKAIKRLLGSALQACGSQPEHRLLDEQAGQQLQSAAEIMKADLAARPSLDPTQQQAVWEACTLCWVRRFAGLRRGDPFATRCSTPTCLRAVLVGRHA